MASSIAKKPKLSAISSPTSLLADADNSDEDIELNCTVLPTRPDLLDLDMPDIQQG